MDLVQESHLHNDPVQTMLNNITNPENDTAQGTTYPLYNIDKNKVSRQKNTTPTVQQQGRKPKETDDKVRHQGRENNDPSIRNLKFFADKSIDISKFDELTSQFNFSDLKANKNLDKVTTDKLKYVILKNLKAFYKPGSKIQKVNDFQLKLELKTRQRTPMEQKVLPNPPDPKGSGR